MENRKFVKPFNLNTMKVTVLFPDQLVKEVPSISNAKTIHEALIIALNSSISLEKIKAIGEVINKRPLQFEYTTQEIRDLSRL